MSTLLEIKTAVASYFELTTSDLTVNGQDLFLLAANQVRKTAELNHDFEFNRKLVTVTVNGATGGDLTTAVDSTSVAVDIKTVLEVGLLDQTNNIVPVDWTTLAESFERQRGDNPHLWPRYPTDGQARSGPSGSNRFTVAGDRISWWPRTSDTDATNTTLYLEVYGFSLDWAAQNYTAVVAGGGGVIALNTTYYPHGTHNNKPLYISVTDGDTPSAIYFIWYSGTAWIINQVVGTPGSNYHSLTSTSDSPAGSYTGHGTYTPTAVVTAGAASTLWTSHGAQYLQWATVVQLNYLFKKFVPRQEGNLSPPEKLAEVGLQALIDWDDYKFEQFRRHSR